MIVTDLDHVIPRLSVIVQSADRADRADRAEWLRCRHLLPCTSGQVHAGKFIPVLPGEPGKRTERTSFLPNYVDQCERNHDLASEVP